VHSLCLIRMRALFNGQGIIAVRLAVRRIRRNAIASTMSIFSNMSRMAEAISICAFLD
jgi:hypothetical protein